MIHLIEPARFRPLFEVVGCFVDVGPEFLLLHRQNHKPQGDAWGVPAGKVQAGETLAQAMQRELEEETGHSPRAGRPFYGRTVFVRDEENDDDFTFHTYHLQLPYKPEIQLNPEEHKGYAWMRPRDALELMLVRDMERCVRLLYGLI